MPLYEYECGKCGNKFEHLQTGQDKEEPSCPKCNCNKVKKLLSAVSLSVGNTGSCGPSGSGFS